MRQYTEYGHTEQIRKLLGLLANRSTDVEEYRNAFYNLGMQLGYIVANTDEMKQAGKDVMLVCASEDADWLAKGVEQGLGKGELPLSVFWSSRETVGKDEKGEKMDISSIVKSYEEPIEHCHTLLIVKSIISSSCVVKTMLMRLIRKVNPCHIIIMAPVMFENGPQNLMNEFPKDIHDKFQFVTFAIDNEKIGSEIIPGIGGMVYPRLGLGDSEEKNRYFPNLVKERMEMAK